MDRVTVFNVQGQQMTDLTQVDNKVNMENIASGIYVVNIETNGQVISKKIINE